MTMQAIGGYFELELSRSGGPYHRDVYCYQSARAAFLALLQHQKPARVWLPRYICESMIEPVTMAGIPIAYYHLNDQLDIADKIELGENDWLVYINYFGLCDRIVDSVLDRFPQHQIIIDNSQAFFSHRKDCLATLYSARKFFGVPDGGYLATSLVMDEPEEQDEESINRCGHLLKRLANSAEDGYADYQVAENSLNGQMPKKMSRLTHRLLSSIDYQSAQTRRHDNARMIHARLGSTNSMQIDLESGIAPLCYPYRRAGRGIRKRLIERRIFVPSYWPQLIGAFDAGSIEFEMSENCLPVPCDQRMDVESVNDLVDSVLEAYDAR